MLFFEKNAGKWFHLSFEHFEVIARFDKGIHVDHGKLLSIRLSYC